MPPNTVKVDRTTRWGNPFIVGIHGTREQCVKRYACLLAGSHRARPGEIVTRAQTASIEYARGHFAELRGKNLACWCPLEGPCHADVLLQAANSRSRYPFGET